MGRKGVTIHDILGFISPRKASASQVNLTNNQWYLVNIPTILQGMHLMLNIVPFLKKMAYIDHDLLVYAKCTTNSFESQEQGDGGPII